MEIYFDNSATTRPLDEVIEYISLINREYYGNPSSLHKKGIEAEKLIKKARQVLADSLYVKSKEIYFTSGGTESNNLAILGFLEANPRQGRHIITSAIEHPSVLEILKNLESKGYSVDFVSVDSNGIINLRELEEKIRQDTALISIMYVNNETGAIQPVEDIAAVKNRIGRDIALHVDAVQAYGKLRINPQRAGIDMLTVSSHKIHGPKGVGALYVRSGIRIKPVFHGGGQESLLRSGTENVSGICGFGLASEVIHKNIEKNMDTVKALREVLIKGLGEELDGFTVISTPESLPYILSVSFEAVKAEVLLHSLEEKGIFVSTGSACSSKKNTHSHVLKAIGIKPCDIEGAVRFSFSSFNTLEEVEYTVQALKDILPKIRIKNFRRQ